MPEQFVDIALGALSGMATCFGIFFVIVIALVVFAIKQAPKTKG